MTLRRPDLDELKALAAENRFALRPDEEEQYAILAEAILGIVDALEEPPSVEVVDASRDAGRVATREEDPLNAIVRWCSVSAGVDGPLAGRRVALKDAIAIAGVPMTCGSRVLRDFVPSVDAVVTDRLLRAGAEIVAVTNMDDLAFSGGGDSSFYGPTLNPFDRTRTAGGSSGGSAAALHYDGIDLSLGCDQGGSIRAPAAWCGVLGLKPTHGLVPYTGIAGIDQTYDHCGPMARTAVDAAALLQVIAGADPSDPRQRDVPERDYVGAVERASDDLRGVKVGVVEEAGAEPAVAEAFEGAVERLTGLGARVERISLPEHLQAGGLAFALFVEGMYDLMTSGGNGYAWKGRYWPELAEALGPGLRDHADDLAAQVKITLVLGTLVRREHFGALYAKAQNLRPWLTAAYDRALAGVEVLAMPTTPGLPHEVAPDLALADRVLRGWAMLGHTTPTDMTGHPALTIPAAESGGLSVGVMLVGPRWSDDRLLALAAAYERTHGWTPQPPEGRSAQPSK